MQVEVDLFSGRPNPTWELGTAESSEVLALLHGLPTSSCGPEPEALGFRGFVLTDLETGERIVSYRGNVWRRTVAGLTCFQDRDRKLDRWLMIRAPSQLDP